MPRNVEVLSQSSSSVTITWEAPLDLGGRDDVEYRLCFEAEIESGLEECRSIDTTMTTLTGKITGCSPHVLGRPHAYSVCTIKELHFVNYGVLKVPAWTLAEVNTTGQIVLQKSLEFFIPWTYTWTQLPDILLHIGFTESIKVMVVM
jgi:hypothetical protein